jgi:hypothetical protein
LFHEAGDTDATVVTTLLAERRHDARAALSLPAVRMNRRDLFGQGLVGDRARAPESRAAFACHSCHWARLPEARTVSGSDNRFSSRQSVDSVRGWCGENAQCFFLICPASHANGGSPAAPAGGQAVLPGIKQAALKAQFLCDYLGGFAARQPVLDGFTLEGFIEFTADFNKGLFHGLDVSLSAHSPVRQFEAVLNLIEQFNAQRHFALVQIETNAIRKKCC